MEKIGIYKKLSLVRSGIKPIEKSSVNSHFKNKYYDINDLLSALTPLLEENKLLLLQPIEDNVVVSRIIDIDTGESVESKLAIKNEGTPQNKGSEITYYRRYTLASLLALEAEDDDGHRASQKPKEVKTVSKSEESAIEAVKMKLAKLNTKEEIKEYYEANKSFFEKGSIYFNMMVKRANEI